MSILERITCSWVSYTQHVRWSRRESGPVVMITLDTQTEDKSLTASLHLSISDEPDPATTHTVISMNKESEVNELHHTSRCLKMPQDATVCIYCLL